jgi:hypothetical protein
LPAQSVDLLLLRLKLSMVRQGMLRISARLPNPLAQRTGRLFHRNARSVATSLTAASLNLRLNFLFCIPTLQLRCEPGSS